MKKPIKKPIITSVTDAQKAEFQTYVSKWIGIGTSTNDVSAELTQKIVDDFRSMIGMDEAEAPVFAVNNPIEGWVACCLVEAGVGLDELTNEIKLVFNGNPKIRVIPQAVLPYQTGSFFVHLFSFYDYMFECLGVDIDPNIWIKYKKWESTSKLGCIYPLKTVTVVSAKPSIIKLNEANRLHCENGPALSYGGLGDFKIYALNGITVPEWLVTTSEVDLSITRYTELQNADAKAEFVKKVGIERFETNGVIVDTYTNYDQTTQSFWYKSEYVLIDMKFLFASLSYAPYLKMLNQTTGIWHMEAVSPNCKTIGEALNERFGGKNFKIIGIS